ncbi:MAG: hypothetical protein WAL25_07670, partial [Acidimicrobiia bacterium]
TLHLGVGQALGDIDGELGRYLAGIECMPSRDIRRRGRRRFCDAQILLPFLVSDSSSDTQQTHGSHPPLEVKTNSASRGGGVD